MSAVSASPAAVGVPADPVRALQHALHRAAKADPGRRFHSLRDKVFGRYVLWRAWVDVRRNNGAAGLDQTTCVMVEEYGVARLLDEIAQELRDGTYRRLPARRVFIPKPGSAERRPLSIPSVRDRVVQAAVKIVLEPVFEADMLPCSFGFRPKRAAHDALQVLIDESWQGSRWVVETDIANCFEAIPHEGLMKAVEERVCDQGVLKLLRLSAAFDRIDHDRLLAQLGTFPAREMITGWLSAGVIERGRFAPTEEGTPQGGLCAAAHNPPYEQRWVMCSVWCSPRAGVVVRLERCAE